MKKVDEEQTHHTEQKREREYEQKIGKEVRRSNTLAHYRQRSSAHNPR